MTYKFAEATQNVLILPFSVRQVYSIKYPSGRLYLTPLVIWNCPIKLDIKMSELFLPPLPLPSMLAPPYRFRASTGVLELYLGLLLLLITRVEDPYLDYSEYV